MLKKYFKDRTDILRLVVVVIFACIVFRLADLQIVKGDYYRQRSETIRTRNISVTAPRGNIVDKYGRIIAGNKQSYSVDFIKTDVPKDTLNDIALSVINIIEKNGDTFKDDIPILIDPVRFSFRDDEANWKRKYNIPLDASPQEAFAKLRDDLNIPLETLDAEAYDILKDAGIDLPFNIYDFQYSFVKDEAKWKKDNGFADNATAEEIFAKLLSEYKIPRDKYSDAEAKKILAVKYLIGQNKYKAYEPIEVAANINEQTRAQIEENKIFLPGVEIMQKPIREYDNGEFASHIIGYMGKIGDELQKLSEKGYTGEDLIGKSGIEYSMEDYLRGVKGTKQIEVNVNGSLMNTIDEVDPIPGDTVFLTIDSKLQRVAEESLKETMATIRAGDSKKRVESYPNATSGAVVAIDTNTGKILALASEPQFDPNLFSAGISTSDWKKLQPKTKDIYEPKPMVNIAISSAQPPGSTMKLASAVAGLEEKKITPTEYILDKGPYTLIPGVAPSCSIWKSLHITHGNQNVSDAIKNSCNYYFFEVGRRLGGELFEKYANSFGFGQKTGIELPNEASGNVQGPEHKQAKYKSYLRNYLSNTLKITDDKVKDEIVGFVTQDPDYSAIRKRLKELGITDRNSVNKIIEYIQLGKWQPGDVLNSTIGQGMNLVTPLQLADYVATVVNGGSRYKPYLVDKIIGYDGKVKYEAQPKLQNKIEISQSNLDAIKKGMWMVTNQPGGTAYSTFIGSKVVIGGKTGTAEAGKYRPDPVNKPNFYANYADHAWFAAFGPYDKPQIAVAVLIFQGGHGNYAAPVAKAIIEQYLAPEETRDNVLPQNDFFK